MLYINAIPKNSFSEMETCRRAMITSLQINLPLKLLIDKQCIPAFTLCQHVKAVCFPVPLFLHLYIFFKSVILRVYFHCRSKSGCYSVALTVSSLVIQLYLGQMVKYPVPAAHFKAQANFCRRLAIQHVSPNFSHVIP